MHCTWRCNNTIYVDIASVERYIKQNRTDIKNIISALKKQIDSGNFQSLYDKIGNEGVDTVLGLNMHTIHPDTMVGQVLTAIFIYADIDFLSKCNKVKASMFCNSEVEDSSNVEYDIRAVKLPDSITEIDSNGFYYNPTIEQITVPDSVKTLGDQIIWQCYSMNLIEGCEGVTSCSPWAFTITDEPDDYDEPPIKIKTTNKAVKASVQNHIDNGYKVEII